jgi:HSP20 family protein
MKNLPVPSVLNMLDDLFSYPGQFKGSLQDKVFRQDNLKVDIKEDEKQYTVHADMPGVAKENINVEFQEGVLTIAVSARNNHEVKEGEKIVRSERSFSQQSRSFNVGPLVDESAVSAEYKDGVLTLVLPKKENAKLTKQIEIK